MPQRGSNTKKADVILLSTALLASALLVAQLVAFPFGRDQGIYAVVADGMLYGRPPYRGTWDFKPPGIFFMYALAQVLFGRGPHAIRCLEALNLASLLIAFALFSRRHTGDWRPGILSGALAVLVYVQLEFWHTAQPSSFAAGFLAWALVLGTYEPGQRTTDTRWLQRVSWLASGAAFSAAALMKPPLGGGIIVTSTIVAVRALRRSRASPLVGTVSVISTFALGAAIPLALVAAYFIHAQAWRESASALFLFAPKYTALSLAGHSFQDLLARSVGDWAVRFGFTGAAGLLFLAILPPRHAREREGVLHVSGASAFVLIGVALQAKFFPYHYVVALVLTALCSGWGFWKLWLHLRSSRLGIAAFVALLGILIHARSATEAAGMPVGSFRARFQMRLESIANPAVAAQNNDKLYSLGDVDAEALRLLVEWLKAHTLPDDPVFIWGFEPGVYFLAERRPASRYVYNVPQRATWSSQESRKTLMEELARARPAVIVVARNDRLPWVVGNGQDSSESLQGFPELLSFIAEHYSLTGRLKRFDLFVRRIPDPPRREAESREACL